VADAPRGSRQPGWREVLLIAGAAVVVVLGASVITSILPADAQSIVFHTPLAIIALILGTGWLLWRIARRPPATPGA